MNNIDFILDFLKDIAIHNNREWFNTNRERYDKARQMFEEIVQQVILRIAGFDKTVIHLQVKDCTYRFYRDTRFSEDKSPYKRHLGAYINAHGKKSFHSGYYFHLEPGNCLLAGGAWCLPPPILKAVRESIVEETDTFRQIVEEKEFKTYFPIIGENHLKTLPKGFPKDYPYPDYLRPKDYSVCHNVNDDFFRQADWLEQTEKVFRKMKPFNDFINDTIDNLE